MITMILCYQFKKEKRVQVYLMKFVVFKKALLKRFQSRQQKHIAFMHLSLSVLKMVKLFPFN
jgi:hypothetical protein